MYPIEYCTGSSPQLLFQCDKNWEVEPGNETKGWLGGMGLYVATYFQGCISSPPPVMYMYSATIG